MFQCSILYCFVVVVVVVFFISAFHIAMLAPTLILTNRLEFETCTGHYIKNKVKLFTSDLFKKNSVTSFGRAFKLQH